MAHGPKGDAGWATLAAVLAAGILIILYFTYAFTDASPNFALSAGENSNYTILFYFLGKVFYLIVAGAILFVALSAGLFVLARLAVAGLSPVEEAVFAAGIGLGALSLTTLALGLAGVLSTTVAVVLLLLFGALGARRISPLLRAFRTAGAPALSTSEVALLAAAAAGAVLIFLYSFGPPRDFDVLEYHLAAPAWWFSTGAIRYIEYNVYSNFPGNSEMLYLFTMTLTGSKLAGAILGKVLNAYVALAAAGAVWSLGRWAHSRAAGIFAAAALLTAGGFFQVATESYVEPLQVLYTVLAVLAIGRFTDTGGRGVLVLGAAAAGLAMGVKYPAALFVTAPLAVVLLAVAPVSPGRRAVNLLLFAAVSGALFLPWALKNLAFTGNPVYPLLYEVFGGRDWSPLQDARWLFAHTPKGGLAWEQWARHIFGTLLSNDLVTVLYILFVPALFFSRPSRRTVYAFGYAALYVILWFTATHRIDRFLLPGLAVMAVASGAGLYSLPEKGGARRLLCALAVALAALNVFYLTGLYGQAQGLDPSVPLFGNHERFLTEKMPAYRAWSWLNENIPPRSNVLLVGEAETFYLDFPYHATTVFDYKPFDAAADKAGGDPVETARLLAAAGVDYIFVNWPTVWRQQQSYAFPYEGRTRAGYSKYAEPAFFRGMVEAGIIRPVYSSGAQPWPGAETTAYVLYQVE